MDKRFIVNLQGKEFVTYEGLLNEAHNKGLKRITTRLVQLPDASNGFACVVTAEVELEGGRVFQGIGDASAANVNAKIKPHLIRMAETRGKARALRDAVNIGMTAVEELGDGDDEVEVQVPAKRPEAQQRGATAPGGRLASVSAEPKPKPASTQEEELSHEEYPDDHKALTAMIVKEMGVKRVSKQSISRWAVDKGYPPSTVSMTVTQLKVILRYLRHLPEPAIAG